MPYKRYATSTDRLILLKYILKLLHAWLYTKSEAIIVNKPN